MAKRKGNKRGRKIVGSFSDRTYTPQDFEIVGKRAKKRGPKVVKMVRSLRGLQDVDNNNPAKGGYGVS